jgi:hypothetical protein
VILSGITSADRLYVYMPGEGRQVVQVVRGKRWLYSFQPETTPGATGMEADQAGQQGLVVQLVAVDTSTGGVSGQSVTIPAQTGASLDDMVGHWAEADVDALLAQQLISGYPDNTFRPDAPITRAEFVVMLARALGWSSNGGDMEPGALYFSDARTIPDWARQAVGYAVQQGLVHGYADNTFRPDAPITRAEAGVFLDQALRIFACDTGNNSFLPPPWDDWTKIPVWAQTPVSQLFNAGVLAGRTPQEFAPLDSLKRGEAATAISRILEIFRQA